MRVGDTIPCSGLEDAFEHMDALIRDGYGVELNHGKSGTVLTIREVTDARTANNIRLDAVSTART